MPSDPLALPMLCIMIVLHTITHSRSYTMKLHFGYVAWPQAPSYAPVKY